MLDEIKRGADEILVFSEFEEKIKSGKKLKIKAGFDPTAPDLHLGHTVLLNKLRQFQNFGRKNVKMSLLCKFVYFVKCCVVISTKSSRQLDSKL